MEIPENPYASPLHSLRSNASESIYPRQCRYPLLDAILVRLLLLNGVAVSVLVGVLLYSSYFQARFPELEPPFVLVFPLAIAALWAIVALPVISLVALIIYVTADRGTHGWLWKATIAGIMLGAWLASMLAPIL